MHDSSRPRRYAWLLLLLLFRTSEIAAQKASQAPAKSCLWKVVSKQSTVYLLGSVHLLKPDAYPLSRAIEQAFDDATQIALEVNMDSLNSPDAQRMILTKALLPEGAR